MSKTVRLDQIKRVEGHGRVTVTLADDGSVEGAQFQAVEFRGFEKMLEGRMVWEMPRITSRVCGICPVSHHIASVKAVDAMFGAKIPRPAMLLRELLQLSSYIHDHALHFFFLSGPDFLTEDEPASRGLLGVIKAHPEAALKAVAMRKVGQKVVAAVGGQAGHPVTSIPGGMSRPLDKDARADLIPQMKQTLVTALESVDLAKQSTMRLMNEHGEIEGSPGVFMGLMAENMRFNAYDGEIVVGQEDGSVLGVYRAEDYRNFLSEEVLDWTYAKAPAFVDEGGKHRLLRVGPLARVNIAHSMGGAESDALAEEFHHTLGPAPRSPFAYHWARMIELVAACERTIELLEDEDIVSDNVRVKIERGGGVGIAAIEAPRGTLIHHYEADTVGRVTKANLVVATTFNNGALNDIAAVAAKSFVKGGSVSEEAAASIEMTVRAYDPCLSCATHDIGKMPMTIDLVGPDGSLLDSVGR